MSSVQKASWTFLLFSYTCCISPWKLNVSVSLIIWLCCDDLIFVALVRRCQVVCLSQKLLYFLLKATTLTSSEVSQLQQTPFPTFTQGHANTHAHHCEAGWRRHPLLHARCFPCELHVNIDEPDACSRTTAQEPSAFIFHFLWHMLMTDKMLLQKVTSLTTDFILKHVRLQLCNERQASVHHFSEVYQIRFPSDFNASWFSYASSQTPAHAHISCAPAQTFLFADYFPPAALFCGDDPPSVSQSRGSSFTKRR